VSKTNALENGYLLLLFNNTDFAGIGDAAGLLGSAAPGNFYLSLHTADPGEAGDQTTSECAYTGYAREAVARNGAGFVVAGNSASPVADIDFGACTAGAEVATHWGIGTDAAGAGILLYKGPLAPNVNIVIGVSPRLLATSTVTED
jgi:hypothetical protein